MQKKWQVGQLIDGNIYVGLMFNMAYILQLL